MDVQKGSYILGVEFVLLCLNFEFVSNVVCDVFYPIFDVLLGFVY